MCRVFKSAYLLLTLFLAFGFSFLNAQDPYAIHLNKSNGLPSNAVYDAFQDSKGFIWFSTNEGLTRYDGFEYRTYQSPEQTSKPGSSIREDQYGRIWYENFDGYLYYVSNDTLKALNQNKPIVYTPIGITEKYIFVLQIAGIDVYDLRNLKRVKTIELSSFDVDHSTADNKNFYCVLNKQIYKVDENLTVTKTSYFKNKTEIAKQSYCSKDNLYVLGKHNSEKLIYVFKNDLTLFYTIKAAEPTLIQSSNLIDSSIWVNTPSGTFVYSNKNEKNETVQAFFKGKSISCVVKDLQGNYWFGTTNEGVYLVPDLNNIVYTFSDYLPNKIVKIKNNFLIATKKGELLTCDKSFNIKEIVTEKSNNAEIYYVYYDSTNSDLFYSSNGFTHVPNLTHQNRSFRQLAVKQMTKIDDNYYAFSASGFCGLLQTEENKNTPSPSIWDSCFYKNLKPEVHNVASLKDGVRGKAVAYNVSRKTIYYATNVGLFKVTPFSNEEIKKNGESFYASKIFAHQNDLYAQTTKGNFYCIKNEKEFVLLNLSYNLREFDVKFIKKIDSNIVILSSRFAYLLNLNTNQYSKINININPYETNDVFVTGNELFLLTNSGIIKTTIASSQYTKNGISLHLNELVVSGQKMNPQEKHFLAYDQNDISIHFSVLDFGNSNVHRVYYRINREGWKLVSAESRGIYFAALSPGTYTIDFKLDTTISNAQVVFTIATPFWQTKWFLFLLFVALLAVGFAYYRWQLNKLRSQNKLLEDKNILLQEKIELEHHLNKSVLTSIKSQMNPHFFYNALNTIQAYIFTNDKTKANSYLAKFSKLTRLILEQSEKETISLGEEIESLTLYLELEKMRFKENFEYHIEQKNSSSKESIELPPMIIQPYVENAIKHGLLHKEDDKKLRLVFDENATHLIVTIDDNGIGRKRSEELNKIKTEKYQSFSTQANEKRLEILNKGTANKVGVEIIDKMTPEGLAAGTTVIIKIPLL